MSDRLQPTLLAICGDRQLTDQLAQALAGIAELQWTPPEPEAQSIASSGSFDVLLLVFTGSEREDFSRLKHLSGELADIPLLIAGAGLTQSQLARAIELGAHSCLNIPFEPDELRLALDRIEQTSLHQGPVPPHPATIGNAETREGQGPSDTVSPAMQTVYELVDRAATSDSNVLVRGESGVGKELIARRIHRKSGRAAAPFVKVHCAALPEQILESELFGYERGAFTGATSRKPGRVELAEKGTLFLDEIGDISPTMQVKLLRVLQDREYERLGGTKTLRADVRFVTATHRNLERMVKRGDFREDLYYRINVVRISVPPLRDRETDIAPLAERFCAQFAERNSKRVTLSADALKELQRQRFPGNVRQLQNLIERLVVIGDKQTITADDVRGELDREMGSLGVSDTGTELSVMELGAAVKKAEKRAIERALRKSNGDRTVAARILGVSRRTLFYKLKEYQLS